MRRSGIVIITVTVIIVNAVVIGVVGTTITTTCADGGIITLLKLHLNL